MYFDSPMTNTKVNAHCANQLYNNGCKLRISLCNPRQILTLQYLNTKPNH
jgi:hypothetical protein